MAAPPRHAPRQRLTEIWRQREDELRARRRWWASYPAWITAAAFFLSIGTTIVSIWTAQQKDLHDRQTALTLAIQRFQDLALKHADLLRSQPGNTMIESLLGAQMESTVNRAHHLASGLGTQAASSELSAVGGLLGGRGNLTGAKQLFELALRAATTSTDEVAALVQLGLTEYRLGNLKSGASYFERVIKLSTTLRPLQRQRHASAQAYLFWADAVAPHDCAEAQRVFEAGVNHLKEVGGDPSFRVLIEGAKRRASFGFPETPACPVNVIPDFGSSPDKPNIVKPVH
jgi:hypothetical protein